MSDLSTEQRDDLADAVDAAMDFGPTWVRFIRNGDETMLLPVVAQILEDERTRIATAIEALHYDAPAARIAQATAARIARGVQ